MKRFLSLWLALFVAVCAHAAGTITVTSPPKGTAVAPTAIKASTTVNFSIIAGTPQFATEVSIDVKIFRQDTGALRYDFPAITKVTPSNTDGKASGSFTINFTRGNDPEVVYRVEVRAREVGRPGEVYNSDQNMFLKPDLTAPKILAFNPLSGAFVKGIVHVTVQISEANLKDWRVQVGGADLPNGQGTTVDAEGRFSVDWDSSGELLDVQKTISIRVRDTADNEVTQNINVTIDRVKPLITIQSPVNNSQFAPGTTLTVTVDIKDAGMAVTGVDVVLRTTTGAFIMRVARQSFNSPSAGNFRWTGRVRWRDGLLPPQFKLQVTAVDRAGNVATPQSVTVKIG